MSIHVHTISSGSTGNSYCLASDVCGHLLLDCGVTIRKIRTALKNIASIRPTALAGCLITHEHGDHCVSVRDLMRVGVRCYMTGGTSEALGIDDNPYCTSIEADTSTSFSVGAWAVLAFPTEHDSAAPCGYIVSDGVSKLLYATDTYFVRYTFPGLTHIMVECNYIDDVLDANEESGETPISVGDRVRTSHMSLATVLNMLAVHDLSHVQEIHLLHLSGRNSDARRIVDEVQRATGTPVYV